MVGNSVATVPRRRGRPPLARLSEIVGQPVRLRILMALSQCPSIPFMEMNRIIETNYGSMSLHAARLERFGYIEIEKSFLGRKPHTEYRMTDAGRVALGRYLAERGE
jgi:DNA-binding MarR family transcriptional regulator